LRPAGRSVVLENEIGLPARALELARDLAGADRAPGAAPRLPALSLHDLDFGARPGGGSGRRGLPADRPAECDRPADGYVLAADIPSDALAARIQRGLPGEWHSGRIAGIRWRHLQALERAQPRCDPAAEAVTEALEQ